MGGDGDHPCWYDKITRELVGESPLAINNLLRRLKVAEGTECPGTTDVFGSSGSRDFPPAEGKGKVALHHQRHATYSIDAPRSFDREEEIMHANDAEAQQEEEEQRQPPTGRRTQLVHEGVYDEVHKSAVPMEERAGPSGEGTVTGSEAGEPQQGGAVEEAEPRGERAGPSGERTVTEGGGGEPQQGRAVEEAEPRGERAGPGGEGTVTGGEAGEPQQGGAVEEAEPRGERAGPSGERTVTGGRGGELIAEGAVPQEQWEPAVGGGAAPGEEEFREESLSISPAEEPQASPQQPKEAQVREDEDLAEASQQSDQPQDEENWEEHPEE
eukprot:GHVT01029851.1.p2 GENE.GHVT01029851.1~~GHVT01029851.1.p2  ORF type:complete len:327 (+),score=77.65 GHVT01029851.1:2151-3131(+)